MIDDIQDDLKIEVVCGPTTKNIDDPYVSNKIFEGYCDLFGASFDKTAYLCKIMYKGSEFLLQEGIEDTNFLIPLWDDYRCNGVSPWTAKEWVEMVPKIAEVLSSPLMKYKGLYTNPMILPDVYLQDEFQREEKLIYINTPIVKISNSFDEYLESLNRKRRYKIKKAYEESEGYELDIGFWEECLVTPAILMDIVRWSAQQDRDHKHAIRLHTFPNVQHLTFINDQQCISARFEVKLFKYAKLVAYGTIIRRCVNGKIVDNLQSFTGNPDINDVGTIFLTYLMEHYHRSSFPKPDYFDPTYGCSVVPGAYSTYKRVICNEETYTVGLMIGADKDTVPPYYNNGKWVTEKED